jgi:hypothetical protein
MNGFHSAQRCNDVVGFDALRAVVLEDLTFSSSQRECGSAILSIGNSRHTRAGICEKMELSHDAAPVLPIPCERNLRPKEFPSGF